MRGDTPRARRTTLGEPLDRCCRAITAAINIMEVKIDDDDAAD